MASQTELNKRLQDLLQEEAFTSSLGYPYLKESAFSNFMGHFHHLFKEGSSLLSQINHHPNGHTLASQVLKTVIKTAAITAPSDLWLLSYIIRDFKKIGLHEILATSGYSWSPDEHARWEPQLLYFDLLFLTSRGYLTRKEDVFVMKDEPFIKEIFFDFPIDLPFPEDADQAPPIKPSHKWLDGIRQFLEKKPSLTPSDWRAGLDDILLSTLIVPTLLRISKANKLTGDLGDLLPDSLFTIPEQELLEACGYTEHHHLTELGTRVFQRGIAPMGIIYAYKPYMLSHLDRLNKKKNQVWVERSGNVKASQDANRKSFALANNALDQFCEDTGFKFDVFIEHAVGRGEATRQRYLKDPKAPIRYFGADLEEKAIAQSIRERDLGHLPPHMKFICPADIGKPESLIDVLKQEGLADQQWVMMVGNGFHEVRNQSDEQMIHIFKAYAATGMVLIFTEETALSTSDLLATGFNTYHSGFRYVHSISGQGLRGEFDLEDEDLPMSWTQCANKGNYQVLKKYSIRSRNIYPYAREGRPNPAVSVTYFCVPDHHLVLRNLKST